MPVAATVQDFVSFMEEYVVFIEHMVDDESEKLDALQEKDLSRIEHNIVVSLANAKKLENYEQKRIATMQAAGYGGMSFGDVVKHAPPEDLVPLQVLFSRFEKGVQEIQFRNDKAMAIAQDSLKDIDPEAAHSYGGGKPQNQYERLREEQSAQSSGMLEQKA